MYNDRKVYTLSNKFCSHPRQLAHFPFQENNDLS